MKYVITLLSVFSCIIASCKAYLLRSSEEDYNVLRRFGVLSDGPRAIKSETFDVLDLDHLAGHVHALDGTVSVSQLRPDSEPQDLSSNKFANQRKSREVHAIRHSRSNNDFDTRHRFLSKAKDSSDDAAHYVSMVRRGTASQLRPLANSELENLFRKKSGGSHRHRIVVPERKNRQALQMAAISTRTRQNRLKTPERGDHFQLKQQK